MSTSASINESRIPDPSNVSLQAIERLLSAAHAAVDCDHKAAKECLSRAVALLREPAASSDASSVPLTPKGGLTGWQKKRITAYVEANFGSRIRAHDMSMTVGLSIGHFFRAFRESFGMAPLAYVAAVRMRRAQQMMLSSCEPLAQVAIACGLCDQAHFTRVFRRVVGVTPQAWRREFRMAEYPG